MLRTYLIFGDIEGSSTSCASNAANAGARAAIRCGQRGGKAARINIWIVLAVLLALLAITRLSQCQHETERICADDPSASECQR
jgi:hypothetical protein